MEIFKFVVDFISLVANFFTIMASGIAIFLFVAKKKELSLAFGLLLNWSFQTTLNDLRGKLDRLNEYNANEPSHVPEIQNILHEISGQIRGNPRLQLAAPKIAGRLETLAASKKLPEPMKRSITSEVREIIKNIQVNSLDSNPGDAK